MESTVTVKANETEMEKLFDKNDTYVICNATKQAENFYKVTVAHADNIGKQSRIFDYEKFLQKFDKPFEKDWTLFEPLPKDVNFAVKGLHGGLPPKIMSQILKIYGSSQCKNNSYVKAVMKSDEVVAVLKEIREIEKNAGWAR